MPRVGDGTEDVRESAGLVLGGLTGFYEPGCEVRVLLGWRVGEG